MSAKLPQQIFVALVYVLAGFTALGTILDAIVNASSLFTLRTAAVLSVIALSLFAATALYLKQRGIEWVVGQNRVQIRRFGKQVWFGFVGVLVLLWLPCAIRWLNINQSKATPTSAGSAVAATRPIISVSAATQLSRQPIWGDSSFDDDEIVLQLEAECAGSFPPTTSIVAFWRLSQGYETNWHVAKRRIGGNWKLADLPVELAPCGTPWQFIASGIECEKKFSESVSVVLLAIPTENIDSSRWIGDAGGWGFRELPSSVASSPIFTVKTHAVR